MTAGTLKALLLRSTGAYTFNPDHDFVADIFSNGGIEITVASYLRKTLTTVALSLDDTLNKSILKFDNIAFGNLEAGQTVAAVVFYEFITDDAASPLIYHLDGKIKVVAAAPAAIGTTGNITGLTQANPAVVTSAAHGLVNGQSVYLAAIGGMTALNNRVFVVAGVTTNTYQLTGENSTGYGAYTSGGTWTLVRPVYVEPLKEGISDGAAAALGAATGTVTGVHVKGARILNVRGLSAGVTEGDSGVFQSAFNLPVNLGGGSFNVNVNASGFLALPGTTP